MSPSEPAQEIDADNELPPRLIAIFLRTAPVQLEELTALCRERDAEGARAVAHKLKGGLYAAGASALAETLEGLRSLLVAARWSEVDQGLHQVQQRFARVVREIDTGRAP